MTRGVSRCKYLQSGLGFSSIFGRGQRKEDDPFGRQLNLLGKHSWCDVHVASSVSRPAGSECVGFYSVLCVTTLVLLPVTTFAYLVRNLWHNVLFPNGYILIEFFSQSVEAGYFFLLLSFSSLCNIFNSIFLTYTTYNLLVYWPIYYLGCEALALSYFIFPGTAIAFNYVGIK